MPADTLEELRAENERLRRQRDEAIVRAERAETSIRMARAHLEDGIAPNEQVDLWPERIQPEQLDQLISPPRDDYADSLLYALTATLPNTRIPDESSILRPMLPSDLTAFHVDPVSLHYTHTVPRAAIDLGDFSYWIDHTPKISPTVETSVTVDPPSAWQRLTED